MSKNLIIIIVCVVLIGGGFSYFKIKKNNRAEQNMATSTSSSNVPLGSLGKSLTPDGSATNNNGKSTVPGSGGPTNPNTIQPSGAFCKNVFNSTLAATIERECKTGAGKVSFRVDYRDGIQITRYDPSADKQRTGLFAPIFWPEGNGAVHQCQISVFADTGKSVRSPLFIIGITEFPTPNDAKIAGQFNTYGKTATSNTKPLSTALDGLYGSTLYGTNLKVYALLKNRVTTLWHQKSDTLCSDQALAYITDVTASIVPSFIK